MATFEVRYSTPTAEAGSAVVSAAGIFAAQDEARAAIVALTGHPADRIRIHAVAEYPDGRTLWTAEDPHEH